MNPFRKINGEKDAEFTLRERQAILVEGEPRMEEIWLMLCAIADSIRKGTRQFVMLNGEPGTGKEVLASAIGPLAGLPDERFIRVNCAGIAKDVAESALLGHDKSAFTGASTTNKGPFERAGKGIVFLDEVEALKKPLQRKILTLGERPHIFQRVGGTQVTFEGSIVAAMSPKKKPLELAFSSRFPTRIEIPPLRKRSEAHRRLLFELLSCQEKLHVPEPIATDIIRRPLPANVRDMRNIVNGLGLQATRNQTDVVTSEMLAIVDRFSAQAEVVADLKQYGTYEPGVQLKDIVDPVEKRFVLGALEAHGGNQKQAAEAIGITRNTLRSRLKAYGMLPNGGSSDEDRELEDGASSHPTLHL